MGLIDENVWFEPGEPYPHLVGWSDIHKLDCLIDDTCVSGEPSELLKWFKQLPVRRKDDPFDFNVPTPETIDLGVFADREEPTWSDSMAQIYSDLEEC